MVLTQFEKFWELSNWLYYSIGMVAYDKESSPNPKLLLFISCFELCPLIFFGSNFFYDFVKLGQAGYIEDSVMILSYFGFLVNSVAKMVYVRFKKRQVSELIGELRLMYPGTKWRQRQMRVDMYFKRCQRIGNFYAIFYMIQIWLFNLYPAVEYTILELLLQRRKVGKQLPYLLNMPFDFRRPGLYPILYAGQCIGGYMAAGSQVAPDLMIGGITTQLIMHCENLSRQLREYSVKERHTEDLEFLCTIVVYHQKIYKLVDIMNEVFGVPIFFSFFSSAFVICFVGFQITLGGNMDLVVKLCLYLVGSILQVYLICWYSQELINATEGIAAAVYSQQWHLANGSYKKMLILIMKRAQLPAQIKGTMFLSISRATVTELLQISYKFFAMLRTMYGD